jgi:hypothetical protein
MRLIDMPKSLDKKINNFGGLLKCWYHIFTTPRFKGQKAMSMYLASIGFNRSLEVMKDWLHTKG